MLGPTVKGRALAFEDQYISNAGELYELAMGHDRWVAELRPLIEPMLARRGRALGICSHPYDLCTELIAREAGVLVTDPLGRAAVRAARRVHRRRVRGLRQRGHPVAGRSRVARRAARARSCCPRADDDADVDARDQMAGGGRRRLSPRAGLGGRAAPSSSIPSVPSPSRAPREGSTSWGASPITPARWCSRCRSPPRPGWRRSRATSRRS